MKGLLLLINFTLITGLNSAQQTIKERQDISKNGIRKRIELRVNWDGKDWSTDTLHYKFNTYDESGNHLINGLYDDNKVEQAIYLRTYDNFNAPTMRLYYCDRTEERPGGKVCLFFKDYEFDYWGNVTQEVGYGEDSTFFVKILFRRDSLGNPLERWDIFRDVSRNKYYKYAYNAKRDQETIETYNHLNDTLSIVLSEYQCDLNGRNTELTQMNEKHQLMRSEKYMYNAKGVLSSIVEFDDKNQPIRKRIFIYDYH